MTCILAMNVISLSAQIVSEQAAKSKALNFFNSAKVTSNFSVRKAPRKAPKLETAQNRGEYYIFNDNSNGGYVIISGDERAPEVLGYSYTGTFNATTIPANMQFWLDGYAKQIKYLQTHKEAKAATQGMVTGDPIPPMLDSQWSQTDPYDLHCPIFYDDPSPTGCVATAMAQIMYYYQWPKQTTQVIPSYTTASWGIEVPAIDVTPIDWENMLPKYDGTVTEEQSNAIATLMYLCGAAAKMDYTPSESAANVEDAATAFETYFGYDSESLFYFEGAYDNCFPQKSWNQLMYEELQNKRPILYSGCDKNLADWAIIGDAHAFILDGYDKDDYFHVNWGWGGQYDGNFLLSALQPYSGKDYSYGYVAIMGIKPSTKSNAYAVFKDEMITFYCDTKAQEREGQLLSVNQGRQLLLSTEDIDDIREIRECVFDASFSKKKHSTFCPWLFSGRKNLREIKGLNNVDTQYTGSMIYMFNDCSSLTSLDVSGFKTDYVTNMNGMFSGCSSLTSLDVSGFKTDNVKDMSGMFSGCSSLTSLDVSGFKTDNVTDMGDMFGSKWDWEINGCSSLTSLDVSGFKTDNVTNMHGMFTGCSSLTSLDVSGFQTDNVTNMSRMFTGCSSLTSLDVSGFKTDRVWNISSMFSGCSSLTSLDVSGFKTDSVTDMSGMFYGCSSLTSLDVSGFKTDNVTNMHGMFSRCSSLTSLDVSGFKTDNVTDMGDMFGSSLGTNGCSSLTSLDVSSFKTENVTNMYGMFSGCSSLTSLDVSGFKTDNVKDMGLMFSNCSSLTNLDLSGFNTDRVWNMVEMFCDCSSLKNLDLSHFRMKKVKAERTNHMLNGCENLQSVILPESISLGFGFFFNCVNLRHVYCPAEDVPPTDPGAFRYWGWGKPIPDDATLYVPTNSVEAYRTTAPWSDFKNIVGLPRIKYIVDGEVYYAALHSEGDTIKPITEPTKEGYTFSGWSEIPKTMPAKDVTVTASFMVNSYKLTYRLYGPDDDPNGDGEEYKTIMIEYGTPLTLEADEPEKEGHYFNGWSEIPATMPAHDVVITGSFAVNSYTLTYEVDGKEFKTSSIAYGTELTAETEPTKEGYTFSGWSEIPATMPAHDVVVTGTFAVNSYALTYKVDGKEYKSSTVAFGTQLTPEAAPIREGYTFSGWSEIPEKMPAHDVEITGSFSVNKYTVTFKYGDVQLSTAIVNYGEEIPLPESLDSDRYTLVEWLDVPATMPAHDITIQASFTDGVKTIQKGQEKDDYYQLNGVKLDKLQKGLNIIRSTDGITRKVLRK